MPHKDATLVVDGTGKATSPLLPAVYLHNFSVKCGDLAAWSYEWDDQDGFPIWTSIGTGQDVLTGPAAVPVNRKTNNLVLSIFNATPGTYRLRAYVD